MGTKELKNNKLCAFCASEYHLEMILLPFIKERIDTENFIIISQTNLEPSLKTLLKRVNIEDKTKQKIKQLNWKNKNIDNLNIFFEDMEKINVIINGDLSYIKNANNYLENNTDKKLTIIDCFHVENINVDIERFSKDYKAILNTRKI